MNFDLITLFPEFFDGPLATGLVGKALQAQLATVRTIDPRTFTHDRHRTVDDTPYGGGGGMVMKPEPVVAAIRAARARGPGPVALMSPQGRPLAQVDFQRWVEAGHLILVAGRYEGFDDRIRSAVDEEVSLGDFVLTGGEYAALVIVDGVIRLLPGTLGNKDCPEQDSFAEGLLEYPHYTRPVDFEGQGVPEVLQSGHHQKVTEWRRAQSLLRTRARRPDLLKRLGISPADAEVLGAAPTSPTLVAVPASDLSASLLAVAQAYEVANIFGVADSGADAESARARLASLSLARYPVWEGPRPRRQRRAPPRSVDLQLSARVTIVDGWSALPTRWEGTPVRRLAAERCPPPDASFEDPGRFGPRPNDAPVPCLVFGAPPASVDAYLPVIRSSVPANRLSAEAALAVYLDRVVGES